MNQLCAVSIGTATFGYLKQCLLWHGSECLFFSMVILRLYFKDLVNGYIDCLSLPLNCKRFVILSCYRGSQLAKKNILVSIIHYCGDFGTIANTDATFGLPDILVYFRGRICG